MKRSSVIRWPFVVLFLVLIGLVMSQVYAVTGPILSHSDSANEREFQNVYQGINTKPTIVISSGAPGFAPSKVGDIDIATSTAKVYISTSAASFGGWTILN